MRISVGQIAILLLISLLLFGDLKNLKKKITIAMKGLKQRFK